MPWALWSRVRAPPARRRGFTLPPVDTQPDTAFEIDELRLAGFVADQVRLISATPLPEGMAAELRGAGSDLELAAVWLGAGLATQIGLPLLEHPEAFVRRRAAGRPSAGRMPEGGSGGTHQGDRSRPSRWDRLDQDQVA